MKTAIIFYKCLKDKFPDFNYKLQSSIPITLVMKIKNYLAVVYCIFL